MLIDSGTEAGAKVVLDNIGKLGFRPNEIASLFPIPPFPHLPPCACSEKCPAAFRGTLFHRNRTSAFLTIPIEANVHALASVTAASIAAG